MILSRVVCPRAHDDIIVITAGCYHALLIACMSYVHLSIGPSVCPSVHHPFTTVGYCRIYMRVMVGHSVLIGSVQMTGIPGALCTERQQD